MPEPRRPSVSDTPMDELERIASRGALPAWQEHIREQYYQPHEGSPFDQLQALAAEPKRVLPGPDYSLPDDPLAWSGQVGEGHPVAPPVDDGFPKAPFRPRLRSEGSPIVSSYLIKKRPPPRFTWPGLKADKGKIGPGEFWKYERKEDLLPFVGGAFTAGRLLELRRYIKRLQEHDSGDQPMSDANHSLVVETLRAFKNEADYFSYRGVSPPARVSQILAMMPGYVTEFVASGGLAAGARAGVGRLLKKGLRKWARRNVRMAVKRVVGRRVAHWGVRGAGAVARWGVAGVARTPYMAARVARAYTERRLPKDWAIGRNGELYIHVPGEGGPKALLMGLLDVVTENMSEEAGLSIAKIFRAGSQQAAIALYRGTRKAQNRVAARLAVALWRYGNSQGVAGTRMAAAFRRAGFHGVTTEFGEERLKDVMDAITGVQGFGVDHEDNTVLNRMLAMGKGWTNLEEMGAELIAFTVPGMGRVGAARVAEYFETKALAKDLLNEPAALAFAILHPSAAKALAKEDAPSRKTMRETFTRARLASTAFKNASERQQFVGFLRGALETLEGYSQARALMELAPDAVIENGIFQIRDTYLLATPIDIAPDGRTIVMTSTGDEAIFDDADLQDPDVTAPGAELAEKPPELAEKPPAAQAVPEPTEGVPAAPEKAPATAVGRTVEAHAALVSAINEFAVAQGEDADVWPVRGVHDNPVFQRISDAIDEAERSGDYDESTRLHNEAIRLLRERIRAPGQPVSEEEVTPLELPKPQSFPESPDFFTQYHVDPQAVTVNPKRFQFKAIFTKSGALKAYRFGAWDRYAGGAILVWKDPADGKTYVVNGHHRLAEAKRLGNRSIPIIYLNVKTAAEARQAGALTNIKEERGTIFDAAKVFREQAYSPEDLEKLGVVMTEKYIKDAVALTNLSPELFWAAVREQIPLERAVLIGRELPDHEAQQSLMEFLKHKEGRDLTNADVIELISEVKSAPIIEVAEGRQPVLFPVGKVKKSLAVPKAKLRSWIKRELSRQVKAFEGVTVRGRAEILKQTGVADVDVERAKGLQASARSLHNLFDRLVRYKGLLQGALNDAAGRVVAGENLSKVREDLFNVVQAELQRELGGVRGPTPTPGGRAQAERPAAETRAEVAPEEVPEGGVDAFAGEAPPVTRRRGFRRAPRAISTQAIYSAAERIFGVPIRSGRARSAFEARIVGVYKRHPQVARILGTLYGDIAVMAHEIAHHVQRTTNVLTGLPTAETEELGRLDYDTEAKRATEGFAEYMRHFWTADDAQTRAPAFHKWFANWLEVNPKMHAKVAKFTGLVNQWREQDSVTTVGAQVSETGKMPRPAGETAIQQVKEMLSRFADAAYERAKDEFHPLNVLQREARRRGYAGLGPYEAMRGVGMKSGPFADWVLHNGVFSLDENMRKLGPSLIEVLEDIETGEDYRNLVIYIVAKHGKERLENDINVGFTLAQAEDTIRLLENPRYIQAHRRLTVLNDALVDVLVGVGVHTAAEGRRIKKYETYVPFFRVRPGLLGRFGGGQQFVDIGSPFKRAFGSGRQILDPIQGTVEQILRVYQRATAQVVTNEIVTMALETPGLGSGERNAGLQRYGVERVPPGTEITQFSLKEIRTQLEEVLKADPLDLMGIDITTDKGKEEAQEVLESMMRVYRPDYMFKGDQPIVRIVRYGLPQLWYFGPNLYKVLKRAPGFTQPLLLKMLATTAGRATRGVRFGATGLSTHFAARNPIRDALVYEIQRGAESRGIRGAFGPLEGLALFIASEVNRLTGKEQHPLVSLFRMMGGEMHTLMGTDRQKIRATVRDAMTNTAARRALKIAKHPIEALRATIGVTEIGPRLAAFGAVLRAEGFTPPVLREMLKKGEYPPLAILVRATRAGADVTTDFQRQGSWGRYANLIFPFFNAPIEAFDKMVRTARDRPWTLLAYGAAIAASTAIYWNAKKDEDWYQEAEPWLKYGFWTLSDDEGNPVLRVPRPFEYGWIFSATTEAALDMAYRDDPKEIGRMLDEAIRQIPPPMEPWRAALFAPIIETKFNWDPFRRRPIVSPQTMRLLPPDQYGPGTPQLARDIGKALNYSPAKVMYLLDGYLGGLPSRVVRGTEAALKGYEDTITADLPLVGGFALRGEPSASVQQFYRDRDLTEQQYNSAKRAKKLTPVLVQRHYRMQQFSRLLSAVRMPGRGEQDWTKIRERQRCLISLARMALGKEPLGRYPNIFKVSAGVPPDVRATAAAYAENRAYQMSEKKLDPSVLMFHRWFMGVTDFSRDEILAAYKDACTRKRQVDGKTTSRLRLSGAPNSAYQRRLRRLRARLKG